MTSIAAWTTPAGMPLRVLLIEDSVSDQELVLAVLEEHLPTGTVDVASTLQDALTALATTRYDVVLADMSLPDADGTAIVRAVRSAQPESAVLVLTGRVDDELALHALAEGAQDYLVKGARDGPHIASALLNALLRQRAAGDSHRRLQLARSFIDALESPTCAVASDGVIVAANDAWRTFTAERAIGDSDWEVGSNYLTACEVVLASTGDDGGVAATHSDGLRDVLSGRAERHQQEYASITATDERWFSVRTAPAMIDDVRGAVITHVDVTEMHRVQQALFHQALHDELTSLPNRLLLTDRLEQALADSARRGLSVGVAFLDLDHFKRVNDSRGHSMGDAVLVEVADRLQRQLRASDTLARFSGDEFVVVWRDLDTVDEAELLSERLTTAMREPFQLGGATVNISASVGVIVGRSPQTADELLMAADAAMYDAKRQGGSRVRMFTSELRHDAEESLATELGLKAALARSELVLHYQPVMDLREGRAVAVEALVRWQHPERGLLPPGLFIPVAESSGLIVPLGRWALRQACQDAVAFTGDAAGLDVAVNLSVRQLTQSDVVSHVREALAESGLEPRRLMLEVTESAVMEDSESASVALDALAELGVRIAIDDFGTGYSSLVYLRRYPISALKLDRSFVSGIGNNKADTAICSSVISLAHSVAAASIAEGVETQEQYAALRAFGCQLAQGFLWSPAVAVDKLAEVLAACHEMPTPSPIPAITSGRRGTPLPQLDPATAARIDDLYRHGASMHTIAAALNASTTAAPNPAGPRWSGTSVARQLSGAASTPARVRSPRSATRRVGSASRLGAAGARQGDTAAPSHAVHFSDTERDRVEAVVAYLGLGLRTGGNCVVVATPAHRASFRAELFARGRDEVDDVRRYVELDAADLLAVFMVDGLPSQALFDEAVVPVVQEALRAGTGLFAYGEMVDLLCMSGNVVGALRLEEMWNALQARRAFSLMCCYDELAMAEHSSSSLEDVCGQHTATTGLTPG